MACSADSASPVNTCHAFVSNLVGHKQIENLGELVYNERKRWVRLERLIKNVMILFAEIALLITVAANWDFTLPGMETVGEGWVEAGSCVCLRKWQSRVETTFGLCFTVGTVSTG